MIRHPWLVIALAITASVAHAQPAAQPAAESASPPRPPPAAWSADALLARASAQLPLLKTVARGALRRGRRAVSIGPTLGVYGAAQPSPGEVDYAITFGLGVELFKVPILPSTEELKAIAMARAKARLEQAIAEGRVPGRADGERLAAEIWHEVVAEVLALESLQPRRMERPRMTLAIEGNRLVDSDVWMTRLRLGVGVWKLTLAGSLAAGFTDPKTSVFAGVEAVAHVMMSRGPRASVLDLFVRGDLEVRNRDTANTDTVVLGVRYLLDVI